MRIRIAYGISYAVAVQADRSTLYFLIGAGGCVFLSSDANFISRLEKSIHKLL